MNDILKARLRKFGLERATMYDFRRSFITRSLEHNDIALVSRMVGHSGPGMTAAYDRRGEDAVLEAMVELQS